MVRCKTGLPKGTWRLTDSAISTQKSPLTRTFDSRASWWDGLAHWLLPMAQDKSELVARTPMEVLAQNTRLVLVRR